VASKSFYVGRTAEFHSLECLSYLKEIAVLKKIQSVEETQGKDQGRNFYLTFNIASMVSLKQIHHQDHSNRTPD